MVRREPLRRFATEKGEEFLRAKQRLDEEREMLRKAKVKAETAIQAQEIVQSIAVKVQEKVHEKIAEIVTRCLKAVFVKDLEFRIFFEKKRGKTEARFAFFEDGNEVNPKQGSAGGALDVASFGLRIACLLLQKPRRRKILIMDEPFKNINGEANQERAGALVEALAEETGIQMIIVTDDEWLKIGEVIHV